MPRSPADDRSRRRALRAVVEAEPLTCPATRDGTS
jgi:hypothetical protein